MIIYNMWRICVVSITRRLTTWVESKNIEFINKYILYGSRIWVHRVWLVGCAYVPHESNTYRFTPVLSLILSAKSSDVCIQHPRLSLYSTARQLSALSAQAWRQASRSSTSSTSEAPSALISSFNSKVQSSYPEVENTTGWILNECVTMVTRVKYCQWHINMCNVALY